MGTTYTVGSAGEAPPEHTSLGAKGLLKQYIAAIYAWWTRLRLAQDLGPGLGMVSERLDHIDLSMALPQWLPPEHLVYPSGLATFSDSALPDSRKNASLWASALERYLHLERRIEKRPRGTVLTTFGFAHVRDEVRLAVVHYLRPGAVFFATPQQPIKIGDWTFPVILRPWLPTEHSGYSELDGNCWVKFLDKEGIRRPGLLTARHALRPKRARLLGNVRVDASRRIPPGRLYSRSEKMDAAVIAIDERYWGDKEIRPHSRIVGYKPVRLIGSRETVDADIVEHSGLAGATIPGEPGQEPLNGAFMILNKWLDPGDSGCLVLDLEFAKYGQVLPYLIYLGEMNLKLGGLGGYGLLIEQASKVWDLECYG
jgi:hypothetical protein